MAHVQPHPPIRAAQGMACRGRTLAWSLVLAGAALTALGAEPVLTGDRLPTNDGDLVVHPINHATLALGWKAQILYVDPVGGEPRFRDLPKPDLILVTDIHGDHFDLPTLKAVTQDRTVLVVPPAVASQLPADLRAKGRVLANGQSESAAGITVEAVAAYNLAADRQKFHAQGRGNGYLLTVGGRRVYLSGDTEATPEMRALKNVEVAFVCMNLPYTMDVDQAAEGVKAFKPKIVYPYHCRGSDLEKFKQLVGADAGIDVRIRDWYKP